MNVKTITLLFLTVLMFAPLSVNAQNTVGPGALPVGSWWRLSYTDHTDIVGKGAYAGTYVDDSHGSEVLAVLSNDGITLTLKRHWEGWQDTSNAQGSYWIQYNGGSATYSGSGTLPDKTYTIDIATLDVTAINGSQVSKYKTGYMTQTEKLIMGSTFPFTWIDASNNTIDVQYKLDKFQTMQIGETSVQVAVISFAGQTVGSIKVGNAYDRGPETDTLLYDTNYGLLLGSSYTGTYTFNDNGGSFTETYTYEEHAVDTNIQFPAMMPQTTQTSEIQITSAKNNENLLAVPLVQGLITAIIVGALIVVSIVLFSRGRGKVKQREPRHCKNCRNILPDDAVFCGDCGTPVNG